MNFLLAFRLSRIFLHVSAGLAACALLFPWIDAARRDAVVRRWSGQLLGICGVSVEQEAGAPVLACAMVVANHVSWLDVFVINALYPCRFVAKAEIRAWPVMGTLAARAGTVFIARGQRRDLRATFTGLAHGLRQGERLAFFPEGTTAAQGGVQDFHANLFEAAIDAGVPVQPYALRYVDADGAFHTAVDFLGGMTFGASLMAILGAAPIRARLVCLAPLETAGTHRRALAAAAQEAVAAALGQRG